MTSRFHYLMRLAGVWLLVGIPLAAFERGAQAAPPAKKTVTSSPSGLPRMGTTSSKYVPGRSSSLRAPQAVPSRTSVTRVQPRPSSSIGKVPARPTVGSTSRPGIVGVSSSNIRRSTAAPPSAIRPVPSRSAGGSPPATIRAVPSGQTPAPSRTAVPAGSKSIVGPAGPRPGGSPLIQRMPIVRAPFTTQPSKAASGRPSIISSRPSGKIGPAPSAGAAVRPSGGFKSIAVSPLKSPGSDAAGKVSVPSPVRTPLAAVPGSAASVAPAKVLAAAPQRPAWVKTPVRPPLGGFHGFKPTCISRPSFIYIRDVQPTYVYYPYYFPPHYIDVDYVTYRAYAYGPYHDGIYGFTGLGVPAYSYSAVYDDPRSCGATQFYAQDYGVGAQDATETIDGAGAYPGEALIESAGGAEAKATEAFEWAELVSGAHPDIDAGVEAFRSGRYEDARRAFVKAALADRAEVYAQLLYGWTWFATGDYDIAAAAVRGALSAAPEAVGHPIHPRELFPDDLALEAAISRARQHLAAYPSDADGRFMVVYVLFASGDFGAAQAIAQPDEDAVTHRMLTVMGE